MAYDDTDPYQGHDPGCICADCCDADIARLMDPEGPAAYWPGDPGCIYPPDSI